MRAAVFTEYGEPLDVREVDEPTLDPTGVVIETEACGICRSDWHAWTGDWTWAGMDLAPGQILGHEIAGRVVEVGDRVGEVTEGDHVTVPFYVAEGACPQCRAGHPNVCDHGMGLGFHDALPGAFAERFSVPFADVNLVPLPDGVSSVDMASLGCRFVTAFHALVHQAEVSAGDWVAIHGCGGVGLSAVHIADALGANVVAVDLDDGTLAIATDLGASEVVNATETDDVPATVEALTDGGAHVSIDALGIAATCRNSVYSLRRRGTHVQIGLTTEAEAGEIALPTDLMVHNEFTIVGSKGMPSARYGEIFRMVAAGNLDPGAVITETVSLEETSETLASMTDFETYGIPVITEF
ncbi:zinc-dependent alcohol dehydrogenase family protein [Natronorarus salvus]|uniref:zinc-dependent alcohol dehydrogenase family protein n=1 Tax=Natronorarus salvus TaxID=3117733 RepID=UPI002F25FB7A